MSRVFYIPIKENLEILYTTLIIKSVTREKLYIKSEFRILNLNFENQNIILYVFLNPHAPDRFTPHAPVAQKIADQRWLIANLE